MTRRRTQTPGGPNLYYHHDDAMMELLSDHRGGQWLPGATFHNSGACLVRVCAAGVEMPAVI